MNTDFEEEDGGEASTFFDYAQQIDSTLHPDLLEMLKTIKLFSTFAKAFGQDEIVPVGSCVDGSKVRTPGDGGDVDVLLMPLHVTLDQSQFEQDERYPAFLKVRVSQENAKYFNDVELVDGKYLPVSALKQLKSRFYSLVRVFVKHTSNVGISKAEKCLETVQHTAVGHEHVQLDLESLKEQGLKRQGLNKDEFGVCKDLVSRLLHTTIDKLEKGKNEETVSEYIFIDPSVSKNTDLSQAIYRFICLMVGSDASTEQCSTEEPCQKAELDKPPENKQNYNGGEMEIQEDTKAFCSTHDVNVEKYNEQLLYSRLSENDRMWKASNTKLTRSAQAYKDEITYEKDNKTTSCERDRNLTMLPESTHWVFISQFKDDERLQHNENGAKCSHKSEKNDTSKTCDFCADHFENVDCDRQKKRQTTMAERLLSTDFVPAFKFQGWPAIANEWKSRQSLWPSAEVVQEILETGCQIVAKRPLFPWLNGDPKNEDHSPEHDKQDTYFRLSFSRCELVLSKSLNKFQLLVWRILKAYQKAYFGTAPRVLASYHWKNVAFWVFQETSEEFWTENNVLAGVCKALDFMLLFLHLKFLPFYFVRTCNLIDGCREEKILEVFSKVQEVRRKPMAYLKYFLKNPPCADQQSVDLRVVSDSMGQNYAKQFADNTLDNFFEIMANFPNYFERGNMEESIPLGIKTMMKTMEDIAIERGGPFLVPFLSALDAFKSFTDTFKEDSTDMHFDKMKKTVDVSLDTLTSFVRGENKKEIETLSSSFKTVVSCFVDANTDDTDSQMRNSLKSAGNAVISLFKSSSERKTKTQGNVKESNKPNCTPSNPKQSDKNEKQEMDIELD